jgi:hypothetical protein
MRLLDRSGSVILDFARKIIGLTRQAGIPGAVIGGVAVGLHAHVRTTVDVDVFVDQPLPALADLLTAAGSQYDPSRREFVRDEVPVRLVTREQVATPPRQTVEFDGITTVSLADLVEMELGSGSNIILRTQDLADLMGLIRKNGLTGEFARQLDRSVRPDYWNLATAIEREGR